MTLEAPVKAAAPVVAEAEGEALVALGLRTLGRSVSGGGAHGWR